LRRAALQRFPQSDAAGLVGERWIAFLAARDRAPGRLEPVREALTIGPYGAPGMKLDAAALLSAVRGWLRAAI
jgi:hypothetical protein